MSISFHLQRNKLVSSAYLVFLLFVPLRVYYSSLVLSFRYKGRQQTDFAHIWTQIGYPPFLGGQRERINICEALSLRILNVFQMNCM